MVLVLSSAGKLAQHADWLATYNMSPGVDALSTLGSHWVGRPQGYCSAIFYQSIDYTYFAMCSSTPQCSMQTFAFDASESLRTDMLTAKSTVAKVVFTPNDIFVNAHFLPLTSASEHLSAKVDYVPTQRTVLMDEQVATLRLTKGELGRELGRIELGRCG